MSKIKQRRADLKEILHGFGGMNATANLVESSVRELVNFRILPDGSLEKRCGWTEHALLPDVARGIWQGNLNGKLRCFVVAGYSVMELESNGYLKELTVLDSDVGEVEFFLYREHLYLLDGSAIRVYHPATNSFRKAMGYAPLYGVDWDARKMGPIHEQLNLLSPRLRVHYYNTSGSLKFTLPFLVKSIDQVRADGLIIQDYELSSSKEEFTITASTAPTSVEVAFTIYHDFDITERLRQCRRAFTLTQQERERLLLYGSPTGTDLFCVSDMDNLSFISSRAIYSDTDPLWIISKNVLSLGSPQHPITSLYHHQGRILAFHALGADSISLSPEDDSIASYSLLRGVGCTAACSGLYLDGDPVILNPGGIFCLRSTVADPDDFTLTRLCAEISTSLPLSLFQNAKVYWDSVHRELWFRDPDDTDGRIFVYNIDHKASYTFDGIDAAFFFELNGRAGFASGTALNLFGENLKLDGYQRITGICRTGYLGFGAPEAVKRSLCASVCATTGGDTLELELNSGARTRTLHFPTKAQDAPTVLMSPVHLGRFRLLQVVLRDTGYARTRIYRIALYANL